MIKYVTTQGIGRGYVMVHYVRDVKPPTPKPITLRRVLSTVPNMKRVNKTTVINLDAYEPTGWGYRCKEDGTVIFSNRIDPVWQRMYHERDQIRRFEVSGSYTVAHYEGGRWCVVVMSLRQLSVYLPDWIRPNRRFLVNPRIYNFETNPEWHYEHPYRGKKM